MLVWKTAAPPLRKNPRCGAYLLEKQAVMVMVRYDKTTSYPISIWMLVWKTAASLLQKNPRCGAYLLKK